MPNLYLSLELNSAEHMVDGNYSIDVELVSDGLGIDTENTILVPVGVFSTYKGAPIISRYSRTGS